ncbi:uncharacterized protein [Acropora muricata]|uniref:uncharacterized protein n=1 Tax=Acropora muricata TaxID=159855 RepID=UPI0034E50585
MKWNIEDDKFVWEISEKLMSAKSKKPVTRQGKADTSDVKLILQMLSRKKIGWDEPLEENDNVQWTKWLDDLGKLKEDVDGRVHCSFVMGKAWLAPIREISTPRLELTAAVISVKLSHVIRDELDLTVNKIIYWTDSTSVLKCIKNETKRFHTFESNRLTIIHDGSTPQQWRYVNREDNPADDGSKGLKLDVLTKNDRWLTGPKFLFEEEECWPAMVEIPILKDDDPEVRK